MSTDYQTALLPPPTGPIDTPTRAQGAKKAAMVIIPVTILAAFIGFAAGGAFNGKPDAANTFSSAIVPSSAQSAPISEEYSDEQVVTRELIERIKAAQNSWQPVEIDDDHVFRGWSLSRARKMQMKSKTSFDYIPDGRNLVDDNTARHPAAIKVPNNGKYGNLPKEFDARKQWPDCQSISLVRDQGSCGSCWAFGSVAAMSDRVCIHSNGTYQNLLSSHDLMGCCTYCSGSGKGCDGGDEQDAYHFWMTEGLVSGDIWQSHLGCQPYPIEISIVHTPGKSQESPTCQRSCTNDKWKNEYSNDKVKAKEVYRLPDHDVEGAMYEIMTHGPITVSYTVYDDFMLYKSGVYVKTSDKETGAHVVSILGWGEENGTPYWLVKNSWNRQWGQHGFFKIRRGTNEANIETGMIAGIVDTATLPKA